MRNISFLMTTDQILDRSKSVTRRLGWKFLEPGDTLQGVVKCQGLKKGEKIQTLRKVRVVSVRRERLSAMLHEPYGTNEAAREVFPGMRGREFVSMFAKNMRCFVNRTKGAGVFAIASSRWFDFY
ncbi:ASCH domain-containing protein [Verrucomicrobia bacterium S94]|nr:ASCH domain-containing protein [Verrucomicrobia bacterium S94]